MESAGNFKTPMLVITSERDYRVPFGQGLQLFTALQVQGVPSKLLTFPDEGHWVLKPGNSCLWHNTVMDWLHRYLGGAEADPKGLALRLQRHEVTERAMPRSRTFSSSRAAGGRRRCPRARGSRPGASDPRARRPEAGRCRSRACARPPRDELVLVGHDERTAAGLEDAQAPVGSRSSARIRSLRVMMPTRRPPASTIGVPWRRASSGSAPATRRASSARSSPSARSERRGP